MKSHAIVIAIVFNSLACNKQVTPATAVENTPVETSTTTARASSSIVGTWYDNFSEPHVFSEDGTVENDRFSKAAVATAAHCLHSGFDVKMCSDPRFLWRPHPTNKDAFMFAVRVPLTIGATETSPAQCFCPPEPGLPMLAILKDGALEVNTVGPDGQVLATSGYTLTRTASAPTTTP
jgi:hypothetical protein